MRGVLLGRGRRRPEVTRKLGKKVSTTHSRGSFPFLDLRLVCKVDIPIFLTK
jgi:hypothetical protein